MRPSLIAYCILCALIVSIPRAADASEYYSHYGSSHYGGEYYSSQRSYYGYVSEGYYPGPTPYGAPVYNGGRYAHDTCARKVRVYDDAGGWVWGLRYDC